MSLLSANTLFHFTHREYILDKFERGFSPRYNREFDPETDGEFFNKNAKITHINIKTNETREEKMPANPTYIPMVCFCDIPLSGLKFHMDVYSSYGIGLKKEWGEEKGLNPIMYVNELSTYFKVLSSSSIDSDFIFLSTIEEINKELEAIKEGGHEISNIVNTLNLSRSLFVNMRKQVITHLKPRICKGKYRGKFENYSYYDEKEWRYVPWLSFNDPPTMIDRDLANNELVDLNAKIKDRSIDFTAKDIKYIIVENDNDVDFIIQGLKDIQRRTKKYTDNDISYLLARIITRQQIQEDF